ncbi:NUC173 domain-containing protein [Cephalotus follicularis]|uniref:NUC173 domain-containing protein n=1 Tax=Cephalotus follicularis TaxID=3775 RepID=A0A1Q3AQM7_CEPFO|nr:NUC173 domain-containing protein [Cephalotus follicularis]
MKRKHQKLQEEEDNTTPPPPPPPPITTTEDENEALLKPNTDICQQLMDRYAKSSAQQHRHLLATAAAMRSILTSESLPLTPHSYFAAAISALSSQSQTLDATAVSALLTFLSIATPLVAEREISAAKAAEAVEVLVGVVERDGLSVAASVRCGVKCLGILLLRFCDLEDWNSVQVGFRSLLKFSVDKRPKVRRCAHEGLEKVFKSFQCSMVNKKASKLVIYLLKKHLPLAVTLSTLKTVDGCKDETLSKPEHQEVLHMLNVLTVSVPYLTAKVCSKVLCELCKLISSEFSPLTRHVFKSVEAFFETSRVEYTIPEAEKLITPLASYVSLGDENPVDTVLSAANLLKCALDKLHAAESSSWIQNVPKVFGSIAGLLISEASSALQASVILKELVNHHVLMDENQLLQDKTQESEEACAMKSTCAIFENILDSSCGMPNEHVLTVISVLFHKLGERSFIFMRSILCKLANLMTLPGKDTSNSYHIQNCIGSAVIAMGPEKILALLPIGCHVNDFTCSNSWMVPILKKYVVGASLGYYLEHIVPLAKSFEQASHEVKKSVIGQDLQAHAHDLWGLLPAFCRYPRDTHKSFGPLAELLINFLKNEPLMHENIAAALKVVVQQNRSLLSFEKDAGESNQHLLEVSTLESRKEFSYSKKVATRNMKALVSCTAELLQALIDLFINSPPEKRSFLKDALGCLASIADSSITKNIFMSLLKRFQFVNGRGEFAMLDSPTHEVIDKEKGNLSHTQNNAQRCVIMELAACLVEGAKEELIQLIYKFITQTFLVTDNIDHREAYHTLSRILEEHNSFCSSRLAELIDFLHGLKPPVDVVSLRSRFTCFQILLLHTLEINSDEESTEAFLVLNEIILMLKDAKGEGRKVAFDMLLIIISGLRKSSSTTSDLPYRKLINMIMGYLSGSSPHIKSGAIAALSVLVYNDPNICLSVPHLVSSLLSLLQSKTLEVIKAVLGFVKVLVSSLQGKDLQNLLSDVVDAVIPWSSVSRNHFRSKVTIILEIFIRKCGSAAVELVIPEKYMGFFKMVLKNRRGKTVGKEVDVTEVTQSFSKGTQKRKRKRLVTLPEENSSMEHKVRKKEKNFSVGPRGTGSEWAKRSMNSNYGKAINRQSQSEGNWRKKKSNFIERPKSGGKKKLSGMTKKNDGAVHRPASALKKFKHK